MIILILLAFTAPTYAQRVGDRDGDGLPDNVDSCPDQAGPRENGGCPLPGDTTSNGNDTPDRDGDGVPDYVDNCPDQPGTGFTEGCPDDLSGDTSSPDQPIILGSVPNPAQAPFTWGSMSQCMVGLFPTAPTTVRIREKPTTSAPTIGQLLPGQQFAPFAVDYDENGGVWFGGAPAGDAWGWVAGRVVANNGHCEGLPLAIPLGTPFLFDLQLTLDPDLIPGGDYLEYKLERVFVKSWSTSGDADDSSAADGGVETEDSWDQPTYFVHFTLFNPDGTPVRSNMHFSPLIFMNEGDPIPTEHCVAIGEGICLVAGLLLPAFGDEPGQCPPQVFDRAMQAALGDGVTDGADFLIWQDNLGAGDASDFGLLLPASDPESAQSTPKLSEYAVNGKVFKLLVPAVNAVRQGTGAHADPPNAGAAALVNGLLMDDDTSASSPADHEDEIVIHGVDWNTSCSIVVLVPGGNGAVMGDGSVMPSFLSAGLLLPAVQEQPE